MPTTISAQELREQMRGAPRPQLVDVRSTSEYAGGHIPCAINIPMDQFESRRRDLEGEVVLICKGGMRAQIVADWLPPSQRVRVLEGGTDAWVKEGCELVRSSKTRWSLERQVRLGAGSIVLIATLLAISGARWGIWLAMLVGAGLTFAGATDICMLAIVLARMPWNQAKARCNTLQA